MLVVQGKQAGGAQPKSARSRSSVSPGERLAVARQEKLQRSAERRSSASCTGIAARAAPRARAEEHPSELRGGT